MAPLTIAQSKSAAGDFRQFLVLTADSTANYHTEFISLKGLAMSSGTASASDQDFIPALTGLRGIAALLVVACHLTMMSFLPEQPFFGMGPIGVIIFFSLSGFLMTHLYLPQKPTTESVSRFMVARFARVYPLYATATLFGGIFAWATGMQLYIEIDVFRQLALIDGKSVFWTIAVEFKFYLLFAVFWALTFALPAIGRMALLGAAYSTLMLMADVSSHAVWQSLGCFISGCMGALVMQSGLRLPRLASQVILLMAVPVLFFFSGQVTDIYTSGGDLEHVYRAPLIHLFAGLVVFAAATSSGMAAKFLNIRPMQVLGEWSFGIYLLHLPVIMFALALQYLTGLPAFPFTIIAVILTVLVAKWAHRFIEEPARVSIRRQWRAVTLRHARSR